MTAVVITASSDPGWVRPLAALRMRGVACVVVTVDAPAFSQAVAGEAGSASDARPAEVDPAIAETDAKRARALRHALAEYDLKAYTVTPGRPLGEVLA
jgi:hypothetical protein